LLDHRTVMLRGSVDLIQEDAANEMCPRSAAGTAI